MLIFMVRNGHCLHLCPLWRNRIQLLEREPLPLLCSTCAQRKTTAKLVLIWGLYQPGVLLRACQLIVSRAASLIRPGIQASVHQTALPKCPQWALFEAWDEGRHVWKTLINIKWCFIETHEALLWQGNHVTSIGSSGKFKWSTLKRGSPPPKMYLQAHVLLNIIDLLSFYPYPHPKVIK